MATIAVFRCFQCIIIVDALEDSTRRVEATARPTRVSADCLWSISTGILAADAGLSCWSLAKPCRRPIVTHTEVSN